MTLPIPPGAEVDLMQHTRRRFLETSFSVLAASQLTVEAAGPTKQPSHLHGEIGITTGSFGRQLKTQPQRYQLPEVLSLIRDELDMRVIDVYTPSLVSFEADYLEHVRSAAESAGCVLTNLKMNQRGLDMGSRDENVREQALHEYKRSIDAAARLGMRWARPLPTSDKPDAATLIDSMRELADYGADRDVQLLVENFGWMQSDPDSVTRLVTKVGHNIAASPDTGNWTNNDVRYAGLAKAFPSAVTCDFKARTIGPNDEHDAYDLKRCFTIGWDAGFRGPWCLEHGQADDKRIFSELRSLRDRLRQWIVERG